jgi:AmpE protein
MRGALLYAGFERWFAVVFWFFLLGPAAALFYRILQLLARLPNGPAAERALLLRWLEWIEWLPARLLGLAFAVAGNFVGCVRVWRATLIAGLPVRALLATYADQALLPDGAGRRDAGWEQRAADELAELRALLARAAIAWLVLFALMQLVF